MGDDPLAFQMRHLEGRIRACTACRLCEERTNAVPGDGPASARVVAIGEAPGQAEDESGHPFVGAAGNLLSKLLSGIGVDRKDIFITNTVKCRPPKNRDPQDDEVRSCAAFLDEQLDIIRPAVILILGRHALERILPGSPPISRSHGSVIRKEGRTYVPLYHPAAALYNGSLLATLSQDMEQVKAVLEDTPASSKSAGSGT